jgi:hypothetical protein
VPNPLPAAWNRHAVTVAELAAYLGVTPSAVRHVIARHHIPAAGKRGRAKTYNPLRILAVTGRHDRRAGVDQPPPISSH